MSASQDKFSNHGPELTIKFESKEAANFFKDWLSESGEQQYRNWMEAVEEQYEGDITAIEFDYFTNNSTIKTECGRLTKKEK